MVQRIFNFAKFEENFVKHEIKIWRKFREITKTKILQPPYVGVEWVLKILLRGYSQIIFLIDCSFKVSENWEASKIYNWCLCEVIAMSVYSTTLTTHLNNYSTYYTMTLCQRSHKLRGHSMFYSSCIQNNVLLLLALFSIL